MLVTVRLFARLREIAGAADLPLELPEGATVREAWRTLAQRYAELGPYERTISCAVNEDYARMTAELHDGDEVAFLPPVSGGGRAEAAHDTGRNVAQPFRAVCVPGLKNGWNPCSTS